MKRFLVCGALVVALLSWICPGEAILNAQEAKEIPIGVILPLSGPVAELGRPIFKGITLAFEQKNERGGIKSLGGAKLKMYSADHQGKPEIGIVETEKLINQRNVVAILGAFQSSVTLPSTQVAEKLKTPYVNGNAVAEDITERGFKYTFQTIPQTKAFVEVKLEFIKHMRQKTGIKMETAAELYEDSLYGQTESKLVADFAPEYGLKVRLFPYSFKAKDFTSLVSKVKAAKPDIVLMSSYTPDAILIQRTMKELNFNCNAVLGAGGQAEMAFLNALGKDANYMYAASIWNWKMKGAGKKYVNVRNAFKKRWGEEFTDKAAMAYHSAWVLFHGLEKAGSLDKKKIRDAIASLRLYPDKDEGIIAFEPVNFNEKGYSRGHVILLQIRNGEQEPIYPPEIATMDPVFPVPTWDKRK